MSRLCKPADAESLCRLRPTPAGKATAAGAPVPPRALRTAAPRSASLGLGLVLGTSGAVPPAAGFVTQSWGVSAQLAPANRHPSSPEVCSFLLSGKHRSAGKTIPFYVASVRFSFFSFCVFLSDLERSKIIELVLSVMVFFV